MKLAEMILTMSGLLVNSVVDLKKRQISIVATAVYAFVGICFQIIGKNVGGWILASLIPGVAVLLLARLTRESVGYGDGLVLLALGFYQKIERIAFVCMSAVCMAGIVALVLLLAFHKGRKYELPFVPFLLCGYVLECCLCG